MRHAITISIIMLMAPSATATAQSLQLAAVKTYERQLLDVTEITDTTYLKNKLAAVEYEARHNPNELTNVRLGLVCHEVALNLTFLTKTGYRGYAKKSFDLLSELANDAHTTPEAMPVIQAYRASALALVGAETRKTSLLGQSFALFREAISNYAAVSASPEFLRGSVAENLPWFFFGKRKAARHDFESIIEKQRQNTDYADAKIMSFTYWAWANQHRSKKHRQQALGYLNQAISIDPNYQSGRQRAELLKNKWLN
ncbi:hypothetical protein J2I47_00665 [Fibrella sp. HMF5335]|uniref:Tetratricopeptide repeat-containing protein n=1 Tax=Fibrella rubiginis TaxID=2817060 RepID=A0A939GE49_9BACT|nr:hypothetical protein [Fibrella rubiginis]MBO0935046.1 hypothetical protein [Fibrella rubiginis]